MTHVAVFAFVNFILGVALSLFFYIYILIYKSFSQSLILFAFCIFCQFNIINIPRNSLILIVVTCKFVSISTIFTLKTPSSETLNTDTSNNRLRITYKHRLLTSILYPPPLPRPTHSPYRSSFSSQFLNIISNCKFGISNLINYICIRIIAN